MKNYQLYRTNVLLGGQMKYDLLLKSNAMGNETIINSFHISPISDRVPYAKSIDDNLLNYPHQENIKSFYKQIPDSFYKEYTDPILLSQQPLPDNYEGDRCNTDFEMGCRRVSYPLYNKQFEFLVPVWIEQLSDISKLGFEIEIRTKHISEQKEPLFVRRFGFASNQKLTQYFNDYLNYIGLNVGCDWVFNINQKSTSLNGLNVASGLKSEIMISNLYNNLIDRERPVLEFNNLIINNIKEYTLITKQLFNFCLCFNIEDILNPYLLNEISTYPLYINIAVTLNESKLDLVDIFSNHEEIKSKVIGEAPLVKYDGSVIKIIPQDDKTSNVLDYLQDNKHVNLLNKNKLCQSTIHWTMPDKDYSHFNYYGGFSPIYKNNPKSKNSDYSRIERYNEETADVKNKTAYGDLNASEKHTLSNSPFWCNSYVLKYEHDGSNGQLTKRQATNITDFGDVFKNSSIESLRDLRYFTGVTSIKSNTFENCQNLKKVIIPNNIKSIDYNAFNGCDNLETVELESPTPPTVYHNSFSTKPTIYVPGYAVDVYKNHPVWKGVGAIEGKYKDFEGNMIFRDPAAEEMCCNIWDDFAVSDSSGKLKFNYEATKTVDKMTISEGEEIKFPDLTNFKNKVKYFDEFSLFNQITEIPSIGEGNETSGYFQGFSALESISLPSNLRGLGSMTFKDCTKLKNVSIPSTVTSVGVSAFENCTNVKNINISNLSEIKNKTFKNCSQLESITFKSGPKGQEFDTTIQPISIGAEAFSGCSNLTDIDLSRIGTVQDDAFNSCLKLKTIVGLEYNGNINYIGKNSFKNCQSITSIELSTSTTLGSGLILKDGAFSDCKNLENFKLNYTLGTPDYINYTYEIIKDGETGTHIYDSSIEGYREIKTSETGTHKQVNNHIIHHKSCIPHSLFTDCKGLKKVNLSNSNIQIFGQNAFYGCNVLNYITLPNSIEFVDDNAFMNCRSLKLFHTNGSPLMSIRDNAFMNCKKLENFCQLSISRHMDEANGLSQIFSEIGTNICMLGSGVFSNCTNLKSVYFGTAIMYGLQYFVNYAIENEIPYFLGLGTNLFNGCTNLESIYLPIVGSISGNLDDTESIKYQYQTNGIFKLPTNFFMDKFDTNQLKTRFTNIYIGKYDCNIQLEPREGYKSLLQLFKENNSDYSRAFHTESEHIIKYKDSFMNRLAELSADDISKFINVLDINESTLGNIFDPYVGLNLIEKVDVVSSIKTFDEFENYISVKKIPDNLFMSCSSLESITLPNNITSIGRNAFKNLSNLQSVNIKKGSELSSIGESAFYNCSSLKNFNFGENLTKIDAEAFYNCSNLTSIVLPKSINYIGKNAFKGCLSLKYIVCESLTPPTIENGNEDLYKSGITLYVPNTALVQYLFNDYWNKFENIIGIIGEGELEDISNKNIFIEKCGNGFICTKEDLLNKEEFLEGEFSLIPDITNFNDFSKLENLKYIPKNCFENCENLTSIIIPKNVTYIEENAFSDCISLTSITIPESVTSIGANTFVGCSSLKFIHIPKNVTYIAENTFEGCTSLTSITIPESVTHIGPYAFEGCTSLTHITIPKNIEIIDENAFAGCTNLREVKFEKDSKLKIIGPFAFEGCEKLESITIPKSVETIGNYAFAGCTSLMNIMQHNAISIGNYAFAGCTSLRSIIDGTDGVNTNTRAIIGNFAFQNCSKLRNVQIPNGVISIGIQAFFNRQQLTSVTIPKSVESISIHAFGQCSNLQEVIFEEDSKLKTINNYAFLNCKKLESITIPESVTSIGSQTFSGCTSLTSITIMNDSINVSQDSFNNTGLQFIEEGPYTYIETSNNTKILINFDVNKVDMNSKPKPSISTLIDGFTNIAGGAFMETTQNEYYNTFKNNDGTITGDLCIPKEVQVIGDYTFSDNSAITSVRFDSFSKIKYMGNSLFARCKKLQNVFFDHYSQMKKITNSMFSGCENLTSIIIPKSVESIEEYAFFGCTNLQEVIFEEGSELKTIERNAFYDCTSLTSITIPKSMESIGEFVFERCINLQEIKFEEGSKLKTIAENAFYDCENLESITIPKSVESIDKTAFYNCTNLQEVIFEEDSNLKMIGSTAFADCKNLTSITIPKSVESIGNSAFSINKNNNESYSAYGLTTIEFEEGSKLKEIGSYAFNNTRLTTVTLPEGLEYVGAQVFWQCMWLEQAYIPSTIKFILDDSNKSGMGLFNECGRLKTIILGKGSKINHIPQSFINNSMICGNFKNFIINGSPEMMNTTISDDKEYGITIPASVETILSTAFSGHGAATISFEKGSKLKEISHYAFQRSKNELNNIKVTNITLPDSLEIIGNGVFRNQQLLATVTFGPNVKKIGRLAFSNTAWRNNLPNAENYYINDILYIGAVDTEGKAQEIKEGIRSICSSVYEEEENELVRLKEINIPEGVEEIDNRAFYGCTKLESINLPKSLKKIGYGAFARCSSLTTITIPENVKEIGTDAFYGCVGLQATAEEPNKWIKFESPKAPNVIPEDFPAYGYDHSITGDSGNKDIMGGNNTNATTIANDMNGKIYCFMPRTNYDNLNSYLKMNGKGIVTASTNLFKAIVCEHEGEDKATFIQNDIANNKNNSN